MSRLLRYATLVMLMFCAASRADANLPAVTLSIDDNSLPHSPGYHEIHAKVQIGDQDRPFAFGLFLPHSYFAGKDPSPVLIAMHNAGSGGSDGGRKLNFEGVASLVSSDQPPYADRSLPANAVDLHTDSHFICLMPQCPTGYTWAAPQMAPIIDQLITKIVSVYHADNDRISVTGFSFGAASTWALALEMPDRFAAIIPLSGRATHDPVNDMRKLKNVSIYLAVGTNDERQGFVGFSDQMHEALIATGHQRFVFRKIQGGTHFMYPAVYRDPNFLNWLYAQRRGAGTSAAPTPLVNQGTPALASSTITSPVASKAYDVPQSTGCVLCQYWRQIPGTSLHDLLHNAAFPSFPNEQVYLDQLEIPPGQPGNMAAVLRGFVTAPVTGQYRFFIASDNQGELLLSSDDRSQHAKRIATVESWSLPRDWTGDPHQQSPPIYLVAGQKYYLEARQKNGGGENHLSVAWKLPDGKLEGPIPASRLSPMQATAVAPPNVTAFDPPTLPDKPGTYHIKAQVDYLGRQEKLQLLLVLPARYSAQNKSPALVYLADTAVTPNADGFRAGGPPQALAAGGSLAGWSPLVLIAPQCPAGRTWDNLWLEKASASIVQSLLTALSIDSNRVYLTGTEAGATGVWEVSPLLARQLTAVAPICGGEINDPRLFKALDGIEVHIITGVRNGTATECANRMKGHLTGIHPEPDVVYEMDMGDEVAESYYQKQDFYNWLLRWHRSPGKPAEQIKQ